jgi:hypothetical protein
MKRPRTIALLCALAVLAVPILAAPVHAQTPRPSAAQPAAPASPVAWGDEPESLLFHVTLIAASREAGGGAAADLPKGVAKALDDIRDFLPYRGYRVVDAALVRANREVHARLAGPDGEPMEAAFLFRAVRDGDGGGSYLVERFRLERTPRAEDLARRARESATARVAPRAPEPSLDATFRIDRGETVVVGSSRLGDGGDALIVLLTAVP